jgi:hypothetical protein
MRMNHRDIRSLQTLAEGALRFRTQGTAIVAKILLAAIDGGTLELRCLKPLDPVTLEQALDVIRLSALGADFESHLGAQALEELRRIYAMQGDGHESGEPA